MVDAAKRTDAKGARSLEESTRSPREPRGRESFEGPSPTNAHRPLVWFESGVSLFSGAGLSV